MKIGIGLPHHGPNASPEAIVEMARAAERLGYDSVWVLERMIKPTNPVRGPDGTMRSFGPTMSVVYDPIETLTWAAAHTSRVQLGTSVLVALWHMPVPLGRRLATLDRLSSGRLLAGIGQGSVPVEFEAAGRPLPARGARIEEFAAALRAVWGPDPVRFDGKYYQIPESEIGPKPAQAGGPPILAGATTPASIDRAGRYADGLTFSSGTSWEQMEALIPRYRDAAERAGRRPGTIAFRAHSRLSETPLPDPRAPLSGSFDQILADLERLESIGVNHPFLDPNATVTPLDVQLEFFSRLRERAPVA